MLNTTSLPQITANQQNARKSTGPRTPAGRATSKMNALKHGILSKQVLVCGLHLKEDTGEFQALHQRFVAELEPVGPVEEMLADQIVTTHWRLRRPLTAESGEIALSVDKTKCNQESGPNPQLRWASWFAFGDPVYAMQDSTLGISVLQTFLHQVRQSVEQEGELTEGAVQELVQHFGGKPNQLSNDLEELRRRLTQNSDHSDAALLREKNKQQALAWLETELSSLKLREARCGQREEAVQKAQQAAAVLPSLQTLERIMRYETKLERHLYRAMSQLERLQRMRRGESVPPPSTMEPSARD